MTERWADLPEECLECIVSRLDQNRDFEALSLVCKRFLSITNRLRFALTVSDDTIRLQGTVIGLLRRFHQLKRIDIVQFRGDLDRRIREIATSGLKIAALSISKQTRIPVQSFKKFGSKMRSLRILICSGLHYLQDSDLIAIADSFPSLEELDISFPIQHFIDLSGMNDHSNPLPGSVNDAGIVAMSAKLRSLCKINLSGNEYITDRSLLALLSNCVYLREIHACRCPYISENGIRSVINQSPNFSSLSLTGIKINPSFTMESSFICGRSLSSLDFMQVLISDNFLYSIREANLPLKKLSLSRCLGFTVIALSSLLSTCQSLTHLDLEGTEFLTDDIMTDLSQYLYHLNSITLSSCSLLTSSTFFTLAKSCPFLNAIQMERADLGSEGCTIGDLVQNPSIQSVRLPGNKCLSNETLGKIAWACPKVRQLDVSYSLSITEEGIGKVAELCSETLMELHVGGCEEMKSLGTDSQFSALEVLEAAGSGIDDEGLSMVGRTCSRLRHLDLGGCSGVTTEGVKEVIGKCKLLREMIFPLWVFDAISHRLSKKELRELSLKRNVGFDILAWLVFSRSSLRKVILPCDFVLSGKQKDLFLRHGCIVLETRHLDLQGIRRSYFGLYFLFFKQSSMLSLKL